MWATTALFLGLVSILFPVVTPAAIAAWPALIVVLIFDFTRFPKANQLRVWATAPRTIELGNQVDFELGVAAGRRFIPPEIWLLPPPSRTLDFPSKEIKMKLTHQDAEFDYRIRIVVQGVHLGYERMDSVILLVPSPLRLWRRRYIVDMEKIEYRVIPSLQKVEEQRYREIRSQSRLLYQGNRRVLRSQSPDQFHSIRRYQFPDPIRHIDPKKTAKFGTLMTRTFDTYFDHHVVIGLDVGRAMEGTLGGQPKQDFYLASILAIAENATHSRDRVSLFSFSQRLHYVIRGTKHMSHFYPVFEGQSAFRSREEESNFELLASGLQTVAPQRAIFVLFTDISKPSVQESLAQVLPRLSSKHLVLVMSVVDETHNLEKTVEDLHGKMLDVKNFTHLVYNCWLDRRIRDLRLRCSAGGVGIVQIPHTYWLSAVHRLYAELRRSARL